MPKTIISVNKTEFASASIFTKSYWTNKCATVNPPTEISRTLWVLPLNTQSKKSPFLTNFPSKLYVLCPGYKVSSALVAL